MGITFDNYGNLTTSQKKRAEVLGISNDDMRKWLLFLQGKDNPLISVIIPVYNCEKYIGKAIESALNQTFEDYEIIVVDDGSTDNTFEKYMKYDDISTVIRTNGGTGAALNSGIKTARGQWIKWLSADDEMYPDCLETLVSNAKDENTIYYTNYDVIDENENIVGHFEEPDRSKKTTDELKKEMLSNYFGNGSTTLIHKKIFEKIGLFKELRYGEDYEFMLRALSSGVNMKLIPEYTVKYRRHPEQLTNKVDWSLNREIRLQYG